MTSAEILERAADVIDKRGHCKGRYEDRGGAVCAMGAISLVMFGSSDADVNHYLCQPVSKELARAISPCRFVNIPMWNDMPETTQEEVTSLMRATAVVLRARSAVTPETVTA